MLIDSIGLKLNICRISRKLAAIPQLAFEARANLITSIGFC